MSRTSTCGGVAKKFGGGELQATRATSCSSFRATSSLAWSRMPSRSTMSESRTARCLFFHCLVCCCTSILNLTCTVGVDFSLDFSPELAGRCAQSGASSRSAARRQARTSSNPQAPRRALAERRILGPPRQPAARLARRQLPCQLKII